MELSKINKQDMLLATRDNSYDVVTDEIMKAHAEAIETEKILNSLRPYRLSWMDYEGDPIGTPGWWFFLSSLGIVAGSIATLSNHPIVLTAGVLSFISSSILASYGIASSSRPYNGKTQRVREFFARMMFSREVNNLILERKIEYKNYRLAKESYRAFVESKNKQLQNTLEILTKNSTNGENGKHLTIDFNGEFYWSYASNMNERTDYLTLSKEILEQLQLEHKKLSAELEK